jgi:dolichol-phosphate mannosyltransferase
MAHVDNDHTIISQVPGKGASLATPGDHEPEMLIIGHTAALPGRVRRLAHRERPLLARASKFVLVGGTGVLVNSLALLLLFQRAHLPLVVASALSAELGIVNNFYWNDRWTFRRTRLSVTRFARFNLVSLGGLVITTGTLWILVSHLGLYYLAANLLGIALATAWNFVVNSLWTWGGAL